MNLSPAFSWLAKLKWQRPRRAKRLDFADMGTAFGLDASLESEPPIVPATVKAAHAKAGARQPQPSPVHARNTR